jgi:hypothetical protein
VVFFAIAGIASLVTSGGDKKPTPPPAPTQFQNGTPYPQSPAPKTAAYTPVPSDFVVDVTVTEQKCFGSAGCSYQLAVDPRYVGATTPEGKWKVVYQIDGGDDPQMGNFTLDGEHVRWDSTKRADGSAGAVFTARVTQVLRDY